MHKLLEYPFDVDEILAKKKRIKRELLEKDRFVDKNIAILGGSTTSEIKDILELFLLNYGIKPSFYESEYAQFYEDAMLQSGAGCVCARFDLYSYKQQKYTILSNVQQYGGGN